MNAIIDYLDNITIAHLARFSIISIVLGFLLLGIGTCIDSYNDAFDYIGKEIEVADHDCTVVNFHGNEYTLLCDTIKVKVARKIVEK